MGIHLTVLTLPLLGLSVRLQEGTQATGSPRKAECPRQPCFLCELMTWHGPGQRHTARFSLSARSTEANTLRTLSILTLL